MNEQEPHVMTESDFDNNPMVDQNGELPAWCEHKEINGMLHSADCWVLINRRGIYGNTLERYWSSKPTDEQRKNTPWI